jgi:hypothetical protein
MTSKFVQDPRIQFVTLAIWLVRRRNHSLRLLLFFDRWKRLEVCRSFIGVRLFPMSFFSYVTDSHSGLGGLLLWPLTMIIPLIWTVSITKSKLKVKKHLLKIADDFVYVYLGSAPKVFHLNRFLLIHETELTDGLNNSYYGNFRIFYFSSF